jgi:tRNA uridine 5-carboxymethylaminomethyl modification enzyme
MKSQLENQENLQIRQAEIIAVRRHKTAWRLITRTGADYTARCVVLATGTFLAGRVHIGEHSWESGPDTMFPATALASSLRELGLPLRRFKTGTPPRIHRRSVDLSVMEAQHGDEPPAPFSFAGNAPPQNTALCHICYTNSETARVIRENLHRSPLYSGKIEGTGPRYCPSIEDKIVRFPDKERHQLFLEPCGADTQELYLQGLSSSLPEDVQLAIVHSIRGLENAQLTRPAYAIEYDSVDPLAMDASLQFTDFPALFGAGQFNGSSGYEEAAAQGLLAGINAARYAQGKSAVILPRSGSYIGTLVDDLVTKGCREPYRMMTARSEYRLLLRQDNADRRLTALGHKIGLIDDRRFARFTEKLRMIDAEMIRAVTTRAQCNAPLQELCRSVGETPPEGSQTLAELLRRPRLNYTNLAPIDTTRPNLPAEIFEAVEIDLKYAGYIARQEAQVREAKRLEGQVLPPGLDYAAIAGLRLEAREKLAHVRPQSLGQAGRISGVSPADISVLMIYLEKLRRGARQ